MRYFETDVLITRDKVRLLNFFLSLKGFDVELKKISELSIFSSSSKINVFKANKYICTTVRRSDDFSPGEKSVVPFFQQHNFQK